MFFNKKWCLILAVFCCNIVNVQGQSGGGNNEYIAQLPKVMHPSPEAMAFMRYGEIPVSLSTGVPEISIPIYTIKANGLEIPISISYHASGIKVRDISGVVGLGWVLNAGGMITQTVYSWDDRDDNDPLGNHDLNTLFFTSTTEAHHLLATDYNTGSINRRWDDCKKGYGSLFDGMAFYPNTYNTISDRFYFTFNGRSGGFRFNMETKLYETIPYSSLKIALTAEGFRITDENGLVWVFEQRTETKVVHVAPKTVSAKEYHLMAILFPGINDPVTFQYSQGQPYNTNNSVESVFTGIRPQFNYSSSGNSVESVTESMLINDKTYNSFSQGLLSTPLHLQVINWRNVNIEFTYTAGQSGLMKERLTAISVKWDTKEVSTAHLFPEYRDFLEGVQINDEIYTFQYQSGVGTLPNNPLESSEDFWGYYNGPSHGQVPFSWQGTYPSFTRTYHNFREANPNYSQGGVLTTITYPTKGKTVFEYEQNRGYNVYKNMKEYQPEIDYFGGLRIRKISNYDNSGRISWKTYEYEGSPTVTITPEHFRTTKLFYYIPNNGAQPISYYPTIYAAEIGSLGTDYAFTEFGAQPTFYHKVTEYFGHSTINEGKIEYKFIRDTCYDNKCNLSERNAFFFNYCDKGVIAPLLESKKEYANNQGSYILKKETRNSYFKKNKGDFITGVDVKHNYEFIPALSNLITLAGLTDLRNKYYQGFSFYNIYALRDVMLLDSTITTDYANNGQAMTTTTTYQYDNSLRVQTPIVTTIFTTTDTIKEEVKHPFHYTSSTYTQMTAANILTPVIAKEKYVNGTLVATIKNDYRIDGNKFVKDSISVAKGSEPLESRIKYHNYDGYANPLYISKDNRQHVSYLWGYKGVYPVAEIRNATYNQVKTGLSGTLPESLSAAATPNMTLIDNLRNHSGLDASLVNTAQFSPLEGISAAFDANKIKTSYDYDRGILTTVKNNENQILQKYDYQFATTATVFQPAEMSLSAKILGAPFLRHKNTSALTLTVAVFDGSDNYSYSWYLKDGVYRVMNSLLNSSSNQYIVPPLTPFIGVVQVICKVTDNNTGEETEASVVFYVDIKYFEAQILGPKPCNDLFWCPDRNPNPIIDP